MANKKTPAKKPSQKPDDENQEGQEPEGGDDDGDDEQDENQRINAIVTSRVKREMKPLLAQLATLTDAIGKLSTPKKEEPSEDDDEDGDQEPTPRSKKAAEPDPKVARQLTRLQNELKEEKEARKKAELAQKEEHEKAKRQEMLGTFDAALTEHGVTDPKLRKAALRLLEEEGFMVRDEETGKIRFKGQDKYGMETMFDPKAGVKQWVLTEGKSFIPAVDAGGSGTGGARVGVGNTQLTKGEFSKLSAQQKAAIELERASQGLPPLDA